VSANRVLSTEMGAGISIHTILEELVLEAFAMHLWVTPISNNLMNNSPLILNSSVITLLVISLIASSFTFGVNVCIYPYLHRILDTTNVSESPLFRAVWVFICAASVTRYTGTVGMMQFTIVTFVPLIYIRVPDKLASCSAVYALIFLVITAAHTIAFSEAKRYLPELSNTPLHYDTAVLATHSVVFIITSIYHVLWFASHKHISGLVEQPGFISVIPQAVIRSILVVLSLLLNSGRATETTGVTYTYHAIVEVVQILLLFVTISTFSSWAHCQHANHNRLRTIICAVVTTAMAGMIVNTLEQHVFMLGLFIIGIVVDIVYSTNKSPKNKRV
jgi:hypothetical protein